MSSNSETRPSGDIVAVTLDASISEARALLVGVAGNVNITLPSGRTLVIPVIAGWNPVKFTKIATSSTTATGLYAVY